MGESTARPAEAVEFISPKERAPVSIPGPLPEIDFQDLTNLSCWLDVVTTLLAASDRPQAEDLYLALLEGACYNGTDINDLAQSLTPDATGRPRDYQQLGEDLLNCSEVLIQQLTLEIEEQRTTRGQRI